VVITLASQGLVSLPAGLAMMLGAEIGTCADTLVATLGRSAAAVRAGVFHLLFNLATVALGVALIGTLRAFAEMTSGETANQVANAHVAFNVAGALLFIPFTPWIARALERAVPGREGTPDQGRAEAEAGAGG
jgi:phosphate:Na+ symporter